MSLARCLARGWATRCWPALPRQAPPRQALPRQAPPWQAPPWQAPLPLSPPRWSPARCCAGSLARSAGVRCVTTLTGFKWIARAGGDDGTLVYGYEQALGYAVRPHLVADKDGISAALLVLQLAADLAREGRTVADRLDDLALAYGLHVTRERTLRADGAAGIARLADAVERVRKESARLLAGEPVTVS